MITLTQEQIKHVKWLLSKGEITGAVIWVVMKVGASPFEAEQIVYDLI
jgi:hypothetical protein